MNKCVQILVAYLCVLVLNITGVHGLKCYQCNSTQIECADPFKLNDDFLKDCVSESLYTQNIEEAIVCRKLRQTIDGNVRFTRSCGYVPSENGEATCLKDAYTSFTSSIYCACRGEGCNHASANIGRNFIFFVLTALILLKFIN